MRKSKRQIILNLIVGYVFRAIFRRITNKHNPPVEDQTDPNRVG